MSKQTYNKYLNVWKHQWSSATLQLTCNTLDPSLLRWISLQFWDKNMKEFICYLKMEEESKKRGDSRRWQCSGEGAATPARSEGERNLNWVYVWKVGFEMQNWTKGCKVLFIDEGGAHESGEESRIWVKVWGEWGENCGFMAEWRERSGLSGEEENEF